MKTEQKQLKANWIAHFEGVIEGKPHDRIYIVSIKYTPGTGEWSVYAMYGSRMSHNYHKFRAHLRGNYSSFNDARRESLKIFSNKLNEGYQDITKPDYSGPAKVECFSENFANQEWKENTHTAKEIFPGLENDVELDADPDAAAPFVVCINNVDLEGHFDLDVSYPLLNCDGNRHLAALRDRFEDSKFVVVEDRYGNQISTTKVRFRL